ncbi:MAG TPA: SIS domain-containing protein [Microbacterium sp.]|uniref:SIS domain-containing protein n=1 Tax=Microbacterium sp. TaxID=51671 RepID=UPI002B4938B2|nr:SIS domain-containing protein [Microbacterium sp.]HKT56135.1 SIS domain-containing protein [Microbacterium sp.]
MSETVTRGAEHTIREIGQQPRVWRETRDAVAADRERIDAFLERHVTSDVRIVLTGAGTSAFVGEIAAPALARITGRRFDAVATTDIVADPRGAFAENVPTLLISFARSGRSPESVAATRLAEQVLDEVHHLIITCDTTGDLYRTHSQREGDLVLVTPEGTNDLSFAMTSSFSTMLLSALLVFAPELAAVVDAAAAAGEWALGDGAEAPRSYAEREYDRVVYLGSGPLTGLARESALKLLELTAGRIVGLHDSSLGFRHGPKSVLDDRTLAVVFVSSDPYTRQYDLDILAELRATPGGHDVLAVDHRSPHGAGETWAVPGVEDLPDAVLALPYVLFAQSLALQQSLRLGLTPDNPFPSGDVNRVVKGVLIHPLADAATR